MRSLLFLSLLGCGSATHFGDGVDCDNQTCAAGTVCCFDYSTSPKHGYCASSCSGNQVATVTCDGPEDCDPSGARYCCLTSTLLPTPSTEPNCYFNATWSCSAQCQDGETGAGCGGTKTLRICKAQSDCQDDVGHAYCCLDRCVDQATRDDVVSAGGSCT